MAEGIGDPFGKAFGLADIAAAFVEVGERQRGLATLVRAAEVAEETGDPPRRHIALRLFATILATDRVSRVDRYSHDRSANLRIKGSFTPEERQLAKQLVEAMQPLRTA